MGELTEIVVDRLDAVDHPASRAKFFLKKSEDGAAEIAKALTDLFKQKGWDDAASKGFLEKALVSLGRAPGGGTDVGERPGKKFTQMWESAVKAVVGLEKEAAGYTEKQAEALNELAKALDLESAATFKAGPPPTPEDGKKKPGEAKEPSDTTMKDTLMLLGKGVEALTKAGETLEKASEAIAKSAESLGKAPVKKSSQAPDDVEGKDWIQRGKGVALGKGKFASILD